MLSRQQREFISVCEQVHGVNAKVTRYDIDHLVEKYNVSPPHWLTTKSMFREGRGVYRVPTIDGYIEQHILPPKEIKPMENQVMELKTPKLTDESSPTIPVAFPDYVPFGFHKDLVTIIKSNQFYPVFITGISGNGKTLMSEQVCSQLKRECIRVNISIETDETDLIGGNILLDGNVVFREGPIITAMRNGSIIILDEIDRGNGSKLMCIQGILEGGAYYIKKTGETVYPKPGFNIIATANTKGQGNEDGKYLAQIIDSAMLERFTVTIEQEFPDTKTEKKILSSLIDDQDFVNDLVKWADVIRKSYTEGAVDEIISTRRLFHIAKSYNIFGDKIKAVTLCVNRFDSETKIAFLDLYTKITSGEELQISEVVEYE